MSNDTATFREGQAVRWTLPSPPASATYTCDDVDDGFCSIEIDKTDETGAPPDMAKLDALAEPGITIHDGPGKDRPAGRILRVRKSDIRPA